MPQPKPLGPALGANLHPALALLVSFLLCFAVSAIGGLITASSVSTWYLDLSRPSWNPPGWIFGPVWGCLYASMAVAVWAVWRVNPRAQRAFATFGAQLALNLLWSALFFGLRSPGLALIEILVLLLAIAATMREFAKHRPWAALLLIPYLAWTSFAAVLNATIWWLNRS